MSVHWVVRRAPLTIELYHTRGCRPFGGCEQTQWRFSPFHSL